jgi:hypothetical protein
MVTSDFICPATTLHAGPGDLEPPRQRACLGFQEAKNLEPRSRFLTRPAPIDVKLIPDETRRNARTPPDDLTTNFYLLDTRAGTAYRGLRFCHDRTGRLAAVDAYDPRTASASSFR